MMNCIQPFPHPGIPAFRWKGGGAAFILALLLSLPACEEAPQSPQNQRSSKGRNLSPFPERVALHRIVMETRAILPRIPAQAKPPQLGADATLPVPPVRLALMGEGRLLRPSKFPRLPQRIKVEAFLDGNDPPGGYLRMTDEHSAGARWPILLAHGMGKSDGEFRFTFRIHDPARRLRYFTLLGLLYQDGGKTFRAFEGYLIHPTAAGDLSSRGAIYPIDFGYRLPEPPRPVADAGRLARDISALKSRFGQWQALARSREELQAAAAKLESARVPPDQSAKRQSDLAEYRQRISRIGQEGRRAEADLRKGLVAAYRARASLAGAWKAFIASNAYRWRSFPERRKAYLPLRSLRAAYPGLENIYSALGGEALPPLREARAAMEKAVLAEEELVPPPGE